MNKNKLEEFYEEKLKEIEYLSLIIFICVPGLIIMVFIFLYARGLDYSSNLEKLLLLMLHVGLTSGLIMATIWSGINLHQKSKKTYEDSLREEYQEYKLTNKEMGQKKSYQTWRKQNE